MNKKLNLKNIRKDKGITLIALVITIIILIILAGVSISLLLGNESLIDKSKNAAETYSEKQAQEELELILADLKIDKISNPEYNENDYINNKISSSGCSITGDIVIINGWQFQIDKSVPKIIQALGKGNEIQEIEIATDVEYDTNYEKANLKIEIIYEKTIKQVTINGENIEIPEKVDGKYTITKEILKNGKYSVYIKDEKNEYKMVNATIENIIGDITISTLEELVDFRDRVNNGATYEGKTIKLSKDIDLKCKENNTNWTPIGTSTNPFKGTFDGNNCTISGLYINSTSEYQGLFGKIENGTVKDLTIQGEVTSNQNFVGMLVGRISGGTIENVVTNSSSKVQGKAYVGGIMGYAENNTSSITKCINNAEVKATDKYAGGISGAVINDITVSNCINKGKINGTRFVGGITGCGPVNILECGNTADITGTLGRVGGILGNNGEASYCYNTGKITGNGDDTTGYSSVGGIGGSMRKITYCYNTGDVYGAKGQVGGICGNMYEGGSNVITYSYNTGNITGGGRVGSIIGQCSGASISYCYYTSAQACRGLSGSESNCKKMSVAELQAYTNEKFVEDKNEPKINGGFPILYWQ